MATKKKFVRRLFWREIQNQNWAILYEGEFKLHVSARQEQPPQFFVMPKIPPWGTVQKRKKKNY